MSPFILIIFGVIVVFSVTVVWAFAWAAKAGQFSRFEEGARSIFDADEPVGRATDAFPGRERPARKP